jgi:hypothetical protein
LEEISRDPGTGIPAHAWELETAEHLLDEWC